MKKSAVPLTVAIRDAKQNARALRSTGVVPGVIYGNKVANTMVQCTMKDFHSTYMKAGENTIVELTVDGKKVPVLIHAVTLDPVKDTYEHIDFYAVDMNKKVTTHVPVSIEGESPAIKSLGAILVKVRDSLTVQCLPSDIPAHFIVNISTLEKFHDSFSVAKLAVPTGVTIMESPDTVIVLVQEPRKEEVVEVVAPAEGEAAAAEGAAPAVGADGKPVAATADPKAKAAAPAKEEKKK